jgi:hypothetical protein
MVSGIIFSPLTQAQELTLVPKFKQMDQVEFESQVEYRELEIL